ncbi:nucleotidyl transferase AbiEii/AbiGii toxin family protein [Reichenbachiella ulvae]|uniref:Nucleotidyl transferase AbiEii/AbiGii toxin family protein n=1 Tax=Reichenbachiella ulvae TaxID=2980104 RepID=A0ABT3CUP7_9BACT|nr:nucleotidyl transferase AbiEii/AbiGii toxin family protein [Reichenbachiella ulvae]MCV9387425.1 nucleotidyl transferase AbiEii/AbiGii toxin family protein [Reichenbachiella ulvae]
MSVFYNIPSKEKKQIFQQVANETGLPAHNVEKDWWVVQTLSLVFGLDAGPHLVFKGGTSLSKSWGIIHRFSEDVDLAVDRAFLGFEGDLSKKQLTKLRKASSAYIIDEFAPSLQKSFDSIGMNEVQVSVIETTESDQDPKLVEVHYPYTVDYPDYIKPRILLEIGCRSLIEPYTACNIHSLVDNQYPDAVFATPAITVPSVNPERTFLEKIFLLHEEFQKDEMRSERMSRHLYDLYKLKQQQDCLDAIADEELYATIVSHRRQFTRLKDVDYEKHKRESIDPIPPERVYEQYRQDYDEMCENMISENAPSFDQLMEEILDLKQLINQP